MLERIGKSRRHILPFENVTSEPHAQQAAEHHHPVPNSQTGARTLLLYPAASMDAVKGRGICWPALTGLRDNILIPSEQQPARIGLIADTHGLLRPEAVAALKGSDLIIHAGDIGDSSILADLQTLAPVVAIKGNIDRAAWAAALPATAVVEVGSHKLYVLHDVHQIDLDPAAAGFQFVISGHSHRPARTERAGVHYVNPGSAGPRRFRLPVTVARIDFSRDPPVVRFIDLLESAPLAEAQ